MDIQNLEMPLVLFKDAADRVFDHANGIDVIDAVMRRYSDYAYLIRDIQAVRNVEMLEELKETRTRIYMTPPMICVICGSLLRC